jgi:hypothetical protein
MCRELSKTSRAAEAAPPPRPGLELAAPAAAAHF